MIDDTDGYNPVQYVDAYNEPCSQKLVAASYFAIPLRIELPD